MLTKTEKASGQAGNNRAAQDTREEMMLSGRRVWSSASDKRARLRREQDGVSCRVQGMGRVGPQFSKHLWPCTRLCRFSQTTQDHLNSRTILIQVSVVSDATCEVPLHRDILVAFDQTRKASGSPPYSQEGPQDPNSREHFG